MNRTKVLVLDDEVDACDLIECMLKDEGIDVTKLTNPNELNEKLNQTRPEVLLVDQVMPGVQGTEVIRKLRSSSEYSKLPVIMVSGRTAVEEKVMALKVGADDYITKPFSAKELAARIMAVLRRSVGKSETDLNYKDLKVDLRSGRALLSGSALALTLTEYKILVELLCNKGEVLTRDIMLNNVLGKADITDRTIDVHITGLRKKLGNLGKSIRTVRGIGYRLESE